MIAATGRGREAGDDPDRNVLQLVGLARRAGFAVVGTQAVRDSARRGELSVVVVAQDATENARRRLRGMLEDSELAVVTRSTRSDLGRAVGRSEVVVVGVRDKGLGQKIVGEGRTTAG